MGWPFTPAKTTIDTYVCIGVYICTSVFLNSHSTKLEHTARGCRAIKCSVNWSAWLGDLRAIRQRFPTPAIRDGGALQNIQNGWQGRWFGGGFPTALSFTSIAGWCLKNDLHAQIINYAHFKWTVTPENPWQMQMTPKHRWRWWLQCNLMVDMMVIVIAGLIEIFIGTGMLLVPIIVLKMTHFKWLTLTEPIVRWLRFFTASYHRRQSTQL